MHMHDFVNKSKTEEMEEDPRLAPSVDTNDGLYVCIVPQGWTKYLTNRLRFQATFERKSIHTISLSADVSRGPGRLRLTDPF